MTESEAKEKICPILSMASVIGRFGKGRNRNFDYCVGTDCAVFHKTKIGGITSEVNEGYCGLAGKP